VEDRQNSYTAKKEDDKAMELVQVEDGEDQDIDEEAEEAMDVDPFVNTDAENVQLGESAEGPAGQGWKWVLNDPKKPFRFVKKKKGKYFY
jgi:hypothetical protein